MGMFDTVVCKYKLPMPEDPKGYSGSDDFQTKDFECLLDNYEIREDGTIWHENVVYDWVPGNPEGKTLWEKVGHRTTISSEWKQLTDNNIIRLFDYQQTDGEYDYTIEYEITFIKGILQKVTIIRFDVNDNLKRKQQDKEFEEELAKQAKFKLSLRYRFVYSYWNKTIRFIFNCLNIVVQKIQSNSWKIENKLKL